MLRALVTSLLLGGTLTMAHCADEAATMPTRTVAMLARGRTATIVCLGDSITGAYYHTGSKRAWPDMLGIALKRLYPQGSP